MRLGREPTPRHRQECSCDCSRRTSIKMSSNATCRVKPYISLEAERSWNAKEVLGGQPAPSRDEGISDLWIGLSIN
jgi:hypothetical protein